MASKTYYFGVGGGTRLFEAFIRDNGYGGVLAIEPVWTTSETVHREILQVRRLQ